MRNVFSLFFSLFVLLSFGQTNKMASDNSAFWKMIKTEMPEFKKVFKKYKKYRLEIIYTKIDRGDANTPSLTTYHFGDSLSYFYPASTVKLPMSIFTMEKLVSVYGLSSAEHFIKFDSTIVCGDHKYQNYYPTYYRLKEAQSLREFAERMRLPLDYIRKINPGIEVDSFLRANNVLCVSKKGTLLNFQDLLQAMLVFSDNESFNKLYDFVGPEFIYYRMKDNLLFKNWITRRLMSCNENEHKKIQGYTVLKNDTTVLKYSPAKKNDDVNWFPVAGAVVGKGIMENGEIRKGGKDFTGHNRISLADLNEFMMKLIFHQYIEEKQKYRFGLFEQRTLIRYLGNYPRETFRLRDSTFRNLDDAYTNYLLYGGTEKTIPSHIRIINIIGQAYGFTSDCAYIMDTKSKSEFMLSARIYTNSDGILNDDQYEYQEIAMPFLKKLGEVILKYEQTREKKILPNLIILDGIFK